MTIAQREREMRERIREKRIQFCLTQEEVAKKMCRNRGVVSGIENGTRSVTAIELGNFAVIFRCSLEYLLYGGEKET